MSAEKALSILIVVGEHSGDLLGSQLIQVLRQRFSNIHLYGVGGPLMREQGFECIFTMEQIAVMGLFEIIKHIPRILSIRREIYKYCLSHKPDCFIGIDAPDFNLPLEKKLKQQGIKTIHYVSPTIWAWRANRIKTIKQATDMMLTLLPFESNYYQKHQVKSCYVGHPLADIIALDDQQVSARQKLQLSDRQLIMAIMPGSRRNEIQYLGPLFIHTAQQCLSQQPNLTFLAPMADSTCRILFEEQVKQLAPHLPIQLIDKQSRLVMAASDVILLASGTATLEAMLLKRPMVVAYRMNPLTYQIAKRLIKVKHIALPNIIAGERLVPELIQQAATVKNCVSEVMNYLLHPDKVKQLKQRFYQLHQELNCNATERAADAVQHLIHENELVL